ncbi:methylamine methyltransferase corrinoid protein reductive activase [Candidatus Methanomassiliicoccus intestinalis]|uniref:methylamine methyltransferase corrinoid protein reductive activase n=1 Tax=Candidatus Methanomassiliicoccus intestinalis TaxID=1406512 RepID=UPI0037DC77EA
MTNYSIALDIGTSGFRAQAINLDTDEVVSTAITTRHPVPGANVIDHVNFAMDAGPDVCNKLIIDTINKLLPLLRIDLASVTKMAVCGNPFQLSLFENIEIRDLAYAGKNRLESLNIVAPKREGDIVNAVDLGLTELKNASVIIPPAVSHEIGADAMAMLLMTDALNQDAPCMVIDYGTNAEMALIVDGDVYTGSAAAGPALEGQQIEMGMLAAPGTLSEVNLTENGWESWVLDDDYLPQPGDVVEPGSGQLLASGPAHGKAKGITGTGVVAALDCGISSGLIKMPKIATPDGRIHLQDGISISENDVAEAGKAIGALRAGYLTLMREVNLWVEDVPIFFMSGASGLYVDAKKAQRIGMVSPGSQKIIQFGNTSLAMAREIAAGRMDLDYLKDFAKRLKAKHCMFATSQNFKDLYSIELSLWTYGMPMSSYNEMLDIYSLPHLPMEITEPQVEKRVKRDIPDLGDFGMAVLENPGTLITKELVGCLRCNKCVEVCPENALVLEERDGEPVAVIRSDLCAGAACKRCELSCPSHAMSLKNMGVCRR